MDSKQFQEKLFRWATEILEFFPLPLNATAASATLSSSRKPVPFGPEAFEPLYQHEKLREAWLYLADNATPDTLSSVLEEHSNGVDFSYDAPVERTRLMKDCEELDELELKKKKLALKKAYLNKLKKTATELKQITNGIKRASEDIAAGRAQEHDVLMFKKALKKASKEASAINASIAIPEIDEYSQLLHAIRVKIADRLSGERVPSKHTRNSYEVDYSIRKAEEEDDQVRELFHDFQKHVHKLLYARKMVNSLKEEISRTRLPEIRRLAADVEQNSQQLLGFADNEITQFNTAKLENVENIKVHDLEIPLNHTAILRKRNDLKFAQLFTTLRLPYASSAEELFEAVRTLYEKDIERDEIAAVLEQLTVYAQSSGNDTLSNINLLLNRMGKSGSQDCFESSVDALADILGVNRAVMVEQASVLNVRLEKANKSDYLIQKPPENPQPVPNEKSKADSAIDARNLQELDVYFTKVVDYLLQATPKVKKASKSKLRVTRVQLDRLLCPHLISPKLLDKIFNAYATGDEPQQVEVRQFFAGLSACCNDTIDNKLRYCFSLYDENSDGKLSREDIAEMLGVLYKLSEIHHKLVKSTSTLMTFSQTPKDELPTMNLDNITSGLLGGVATNRDKSNMLQDTEDDARTTAIGLSAFDDVNEMFKAKDQKESTDDKPVITKSASTDKTEQNYIALESKSIATVNDLVSALFQGLSLDDDEFVTANDYIKWIHHNPYSVSFLERVKHIALTHSKRQFLRHLSNEEREVIEEFFSKMNPRTGDECYLISAKWWRLWSDYVGFNRVTDDSDDVEINYPPGEIDNDDLVEDENELDSFPLLKENLLEGVNYVVVSKEIWNSLASWYGGGPAIVRQVIQVDEARAKRKSIIDTSKSMPRFPSTTIDLDLYPLLLGLGFYKERKVIGRCLCSSEISGDELRELACKQLNVPFQPGMKFWTMFPGTEPVLIDETSRSLRELGLIPGYIILLDAKSRHERSVTAVLPKWLYKSSQHELEAVQPQQATGGGLVGLTNLGNTCFLNSALQALCHTPILVNYLLEDKYVEDMNTVESDGKITNEFVNLVKHMWQSRPFTYIAPQNMRMALIKRAPQFGGTEQHDSQEVLGMLLDFLHTELNLVKEKLSKELPDYTGQSDEELAEIYWKNHLLRDASLIVSLFEGQFKSHCVCIACKHEIIKYHPFMFLSLPLPENTTQVFTITLVSSNEGEHPMICKVRVDKEGTVSDLVSALNNTLKIDIAANTLLFAEVQDHHVFGFLKKSRELQDVTERDNVFAFQLDTNTDDMRETLSDTALPKPTRAVSEESIEEEDEQQEIRATKMTKLSKLVIKKNTKSRIVLLHRRTKAEWTLTGRRPKNVLFGLPLVMTISTGNERKLSGKLLYEMVLERLKSSFDVVPLTKEFNSQKASSKGNLSSPSSPMPTTPTTPVTPSTDKSRPSSGSSVKQLPDWPFGLRYVNNSGTGCSRCVSEIYSPKLACTGCLVEFNDGPIELNDGDTIAIEWNLKRTKTNSAAVDKVFSTVEEHPSMKELENMSDGLLRLEDVIQEYEKAEWMSEDDYHCPQCKGPRPGIKRETIWRLPPILMVQLKRFAFTIHGCVKNDIMISFPIKGLNMSPYHTKQAEGNRKNLLELMPNLRTDNSHKPFPLDKSGQPLLYDLYAVISHLGTFYDGHYITHAKDLTRNSWYCFNDESCREWNPTTDPVSSYHAYVLFYHQQNLPTLNNLRQNMRESLEAILAENKS